MPECLSVGGELQILVVSAWFSQSIWLTLPTSVTFGIAVTQYLIRNNLKKEEFTLVHVSWGTVHSVGGGVVTEVTCSYNGRSLLRSGSFSETGNGARL